MKILLVNYEYKGQGGGAGQQMYYLAQALRDSGHDVSLLIGWDNTLGLPELLDGITTHIVKHKRKNIQLSTPLGMLFFVMRGLLCINRLTKEQKYDIIQFYFSVPTGILKYGIKGRIPYVVSLRGMDIPGLHKGKNKVLSVFTSALNRNITRSASNILCNSTESASTYRKFEPYANITVIPNSIDLKIRKKTSYSEEILRFVTVGRLISVKHIDILIESITVLQKTYPGITLDVYGQGYLYNSLRKQILDNKAEGFIHLKGYIGKVDLLEALCENDVFLFASIGDSCPNVLIEAMACGLPVLTSRSAGSIDIVREGVTGLFSFPGDLNDTMKKIEFCINNPQEMKKYGLNGRKHVEMAYTTESAALKHIDVFSKLLKQKNYNGRRFM